ncbi:MAG: undecaprenyl-diphosphate phosphatase [Gammaproteobacteria bacterium]
MDLLQLIVLAIVQGLTEFLPISSSAHLILLPLLTGWEDQGLAYDVAVHFGSLFAVMFYFRDDIKKVLFAWFSSVLGGEATENSRLGWAVIIGTIPAVIVGFLMKDYIETVLRSPLVIAATTIIFGLLLWYSDATATHHRTEKTLTAKDALKIGLAQTLALIPGTSRSGITMTAGLMLGLTRNAAARFSFLLSIPLILAATGLKTKDLISSGQAVDWFGLIFVIVLSMISAYICIHYFLKLINKIGMLPFVIYRLGLGFFLLWMFF